MTMFVPVKVKAFITLMQAIFLLSTKAGFCMKQDSACRPFCTGSDCITLNQERLDFKTAKEACRNKNGELVTFQLETDENILHILNQDLHGDFWIGLHLPDGACSNLSAPLRGYEWISGSMHRSFIPSFSTWKDSVKVCSPRCVSLSNDQKLTERLCSDQTDGFLCKTKHKDACQAQEISNSFFFQSSQDCSSGPCEHTCTDVKGGYECTCFKGYMPDSKAPKQCKLHCAQQKCPAVNTYECPIGFIREENMCIDVNECEMDYCDHKCINTFGSFMCSCKEGFVLKGEVKCTEAADSNGFVFTTPAAVGFLKPTPNNTVKDSFASASGFLWMWIFIAVAVVVLIFVIRFCVVKHQKNREQNSIQQSSFPVDNIEC
ncbi:Endosialin Tumor endothelial marker 1 [Collichthys lucidus]|uniref:Endosialin Tumor endothelial marker 1 n=1 Tax=Collichthys lucidus TaxID=240159 RepID=A0A4U5VEA3_COLLU|nr:Endosialin Tumor endothelial marker 1 [Collichthys lucidus]